MSLKILWNWIGSKLRKPAEKPEVVEKSDNELIKYIEKEKRKEYSFDRFKRWLREQNEEHTFAKEISEGTTVYFSDDFAAAYDLRIRGLEDTNPFIIVQTDIGMGLGEEGEINQHFLESVVKIWSTMRAEIWYIDPQIEWLVVINEQGRTRYGIDDLITSTRIDFQFKLSDIV
jgi:hypothetical protein